MKRTYLYAIAAVLIAIIIAVPLYYYYNTTSSAGNEIKVGVVTSLTGGQARIGEDQKYAAEIWTDEVNAKGGILGKNVTLIAGDDESNPDKAQLVTERVIVEDKVDALVGSCFSSCGIIESQVAETNGVPTVISGAATNKILDPPKQWVFRTAMKTSAWSIAISDIIINWIYPKLPAPHNYTIVSDNSDFGLDITRPGADYLTAHTNATKLGFIIIDLKATDFTSEVAGLLNQNPQVIFMVISGAPGALFVNQMRNAGVRGLTIGYASYFLTPEFGTVTQANSEYHIGCGYATAKPLTTLTMAFHDKFVQRFGREPVDMAYATYDACLALEDSIRRAGTLDKSAVQQALVSTDILGTMSQINFNSTTHERNIFTILAFEWQNRTLKTVYPDRLADVQLKTP